MVLPWGGNRRVGATLLWCHGPDISGNCHIRAVQSCGDEPANGTHWQWRWTVHHNKSQRSSDCSPHRGSVTSLSSQTSLFHHVFTYQILVWSTRSHPNSSSIAALSVDVQLFIIPYCIVLDVQGQRVNLIHSLTGNVKFLLVTHMQSFSK